MKSVFTTKDGSEAYFWANKATTMAKIRTAIKESFVPPLLWQLLAMGQSVAFMVIMA
jgi:hypothetical protein